MRILVLGIGPLPCEDPPVLNACCHRSWQFAKPLADAGHGVTLVCLRIPHPALTGDPVVEKDLGGIRYLLVDEATRFRNDEFMRSILREVAPDGVIGANVYPASRACELDPPVPVWADINGYIMAEAQAHAERLNHDEQVTHFWLQMIPALRRGDVFSACSPQQRLALIGELGAMQRLNKANFGYELVHTVPAAREAAPYPPAEVKLKGGSIPEDGFVVLSPGVPYVWWDIPGSFEALEKAIEENPKIHFVLLGGDRPGQDKETHAAIVRSAGDSKYRSNYHLFGWVKPSEVAAWLLRADVGLSMDRECYEPYFGTRNRVVEMLKAGLPPVMTRGTEISRQVEDNGLGLVSPIGDPHALARNLVRASRNPGELAEMGTRSREFFLKHYTLEATSGPFLTWAAQPWHAPDHVERRRTIPPTPLKPRGVGGIETRGGKTTLSPARRLARRMKRVFLRRS
jgi:glycosyltransferase involved in cell wall biosynthesis